MGRLPDEKLLVLVAMVGFLAFAAAGTAGHEMWRDEHHAWLLARDAASPVEVIRNLEWDMTPPVWHLVLWVATRFTHDPAAMQVVNLVFATLAAWLVLRFAPFELPVRVLIVFGYFLAYEYAAISRVYALGALFIFTLCALWPERDRRAVAIGVLLVLLANTPSLYGAIAAGFFVLLLLVELRTRPQWRRSALTTIVIGGVGILLALAQAMPRAENPFARGKMTAAFEPERIARLAELVVKVVIPIPDAGVYEWWSSNVIAGRIAVLDLGLAVACLGLLAFLLRRHGAPLVAWGAVTAAVLFAGYQGFFLSVRHGSFIAVMFLAALWIGLRARPDAKPERGERVVLVALLAIWVAGAVVALAKELRTEFTAVDAAARYLREENLDRLPIAGANDFVVASLASVLDLDRIYYPQKNGWGTFVRWSPDRRLHTTLGEVGRDVASMVESSGEPMVVVLSEAPTRPGPSGDELIESAMLSPSVGIRLRAAFTESVVPDEKLWVYVAEPVR
jgi:hypothetical protein